MTKPSNKKLCSDILKRMGEHPGIVEYFAYGRFHDLWGIIDLISTDKNGFIRWIQVFSAIKGSGGFSNHMKKMDDSQREIIECVLQSPYNRFELWGRKEASKTIEKHFSVHKYHQKTGGLEGEPMKYRYFYNGRIQFRK